MKTLLFTAGILLSSSFLFSQETYSQSATAGQVARIDRSRVKQNSITCLSRNAVGGASCTQAQACVAYGAAGGAGCSVAQARATSPSCEIFANTQPGRDAYVTSIIVKQISEFTVQATNEDLSVTRLWWTTVATRGQKDAVCTAVVPSLGANCEIFQ